LLRGSFILPNWSSGNVYRLPPRHSFYAKNKKIRRQALQTHEHWKTDAPHTGFPSPFGCKKHQVQAPCFPRQAGRSRSSTDVNALPAVWLVGAEGKSSRHGSGGFCRLTRPDIREKAAFFPRTVKLSRPVAGRVAFDASCALPRFLGAREGSGPAPNARGWPAFTLSAGGVADRHSAGAGPLPCGTPLRFARNK
jgi:hypothetical protein